tara:strand:- start:60 stop:2633 length:2574 start_codon:yes stop_codon:yes gene_type:complete
MSYKNCIIQGVKNGDITPEQAKKQNEMLDELKAYYLEKKGLNQAEAERVAAKQTFDQSKIDAAKKLKYAILQKQKFQEIENVFKTYRNSNGEVDYANAYRALMAQDNFANIPNIERIVDIERGKAHQHMVNILDQMQYKMGGRQTKLQKSNLKLMVRELMGEDTGNQNAKQLAEAWKRVSDHLRKRANYFGMNILSRRDWGLPQIHDTLLVRSVPKQEWIDYVLPKLDIDKMINERSGLPFNDKTIQEALSEVYDNIATEGMATFKPGKDSFGRALHNRRTDHRFLAFKNADDWMEYQTRFGSPDPFKTMMEHINGMSRDIAMLKILGPNPDATHIWAVGMIKKQSSIDTAAEALGNFKRKKTFLKDKKGKDGKIKKVRRTEDDRTEFILDNVNNLYAYHKGTLHKPIDGFFGRTFAALRQILTSAQLGGAAIMTITDHHWSRMTAKFNGLSANKANRNAVKFLAEGIKKNKALSRTAMRSGLIAEHHGTISGIQARFLNEVDAPLLSKRVSDLVLRASGLQHSTQSNKWAFGMLMQGTLADESGKVFSKLDPNLQSQLQKYGIGDKEWEIIRQTKKYDAAVDEPTIKEGEVVLLRPDDIHARADLDDATREYLTTRLLMWITNETNFAVPTSSAKGRITLSGKAQPGTVTGEITNSILMYKNFPITLGMTHLSRGFQQTGIKGKFKYLAPMLIGGMVMGALAYEIKQVAAGKKPTPVSKMGARYWMNAAVYGGGLGIFGDFLFADTNRYGGSMAKTLTGPVINFIDDLTRLTGGNLQQLASGEKTNAGKELTRFIKNYTPGSNLWYTRLVFERIFMDTIEKLLNPNFHSDTRRNVNRIKKKTGQEYWWSPGELTPN